MRKEVEIIEESVESEENKKVKLTSSYLKDLLRNRGSLSVLRDYTIPESFILENKELFDKKIVIGSLNLSENFITESLESNYFLIEDLKDLSMTTYAQLSKSFLKLYADSLNWNKIMTYLLSSEQIKDINKYLHVIEKYDLWSCISISGDLPIEFIREYKDKLDWKYLSMTQNFTPDDTIEFIDYIVDVRSEPANENDKLFNIDVD